MAIPTHRILQGLAEAMTWQEVFLKRFQKIGIKL